MPPRDAPLDSTLDVGGVRFLVRHDFDLIRRIESAFGPIRDLNKRIAAQSIRADEVADLYGSVLAKSARPPERPDVEEHVMRHGIVRCCSGLLALTLNLFAGNERAAEWIATEIERRSIQDDDDILEGAPRPPKAA